MISRNAAKSNLTFLAMVFAIGLIAFIMVFEHGREDREVSVQEQFDKIVLKKDMLLFVAPEGANGNSFSSMRISYTDAGFGVTLSGRQGEVLFVAQISTDNTLNYTRFVNDSSYFDANGDGIHELLIKKQGDDFVRYYLTESPWVNDSTLQTSE
ncbi:MAG: hypothetical protein ACFBZ8_11260 [Opitutales bacterium]